MPDNQTTTKPAAKPKCLGWFIPATNICRNCRRDRSWHQTNQRGRELQIKWESLRATYGFIDDGLDTRAGYRIRANRQTRR